MKKIEKSIELGGRKLTLATGHIASQATSAVIAAYGETVVMATVVAQELKEDWGYFPLEVEYQERLYAGGRIKGSRWVKREGRPSDDEVVTARLIDRSIRPLFPKEYNKEVQIMVTVLSVDLENSPDIPAGIAVSAALAASSIPWHGPVSILKVGLNNGQYFLNPQDKDLVTSEMELVVSNTKDAVVMIEAGANEVDEKKILEGIEFVEQQSTALIKFLEEFAQEVGRKKEEIKIAKTNSDLQKKVKELTKDKLADLIKKMATKEVSYADFDEVVRAMVNSVSDEEKVEVKPIFNSLFESEVRKMILSGVRPDSRKPDEIRELSCQVGVLPRTHGSAIFNRGLTQALTIATLGAPSLEQTTETAEGEETKRYIHHYSMPPYSSGETGKIGSPKRREIGHGALAEKALFPVIPTEEEFPYTIRVVSEILSSNGSTSMASTCGSTLSLMDAGVPIKAPVAGVAMGLIVENSSTDTKAKTDKSKGQGKYVVLTDIAGLEDGVGDMDFKIAGTKNGITALQLDVKTQKLTLSILKDAFKKGKEARLKILKVMSSTIDKPRPQVSEYAPKIRVIKIDIEKIGEVIGPGGRTIKGIIAKTDAQVDVGDDGTVSISSQSDESVEAALAMIEGLVKEIQAGEIYEGEVKRIEPFGAFLEILPGKDGLVHVSDMSEEFVQDPTEFVKIGDKVKVRVKEIDQMGRVNLSMLLDKRADERKRGRQLPERGYRLSSRSQRRFGQRNGRSEFSRGRSAGSRWGRSKGPHFPTSRLMDDRKKNFSR